MSWASPTTLRVHQRREVPFDDATEGDDVDGMEERLYETREFRKRIVPEL
jgi:hypothetical protein